MKQIFNKVIKNENGFSHIEIVLVIVFVIAIIGVGGYVYQKNVGDTYKKNIIPAYTNQGEQMKLVGESLKRNVWTNRNSTADSDAKDFAYIQTNITKEIAYTDKLAKTNDVIVLPGSTVISSVKKLKTTRDLMKVYIKDSGVFLNDYQELLNYARDSSSIGYKDINATFVDVSQINASSSPSQILTSYSSALKSINSAISSYKKLTPPSDLASYNQQVISRLQDIGNGLSSSINDINSNNLNKLATDSVALSQAATALITLGNTDLYTRLSTNSVIHSDLVKLKADNPLGI
jgi:hypothetical protein